MNCRIRSVLAREHSWLVIIHEVILFLFIGVLIEANITNIFLPQVARQIKRHSHVKKFMFGFKGYFCEEKLTIIGRG